MDIIPELPNHLERINDELGEAQRLQFFIDQLASHEEKTNLSTQVLDTLNRNWEMKNQTIELIGKIIGPDPQDPSSNIYHDYIRGHNIGFDYIDIPLAGENCFMITIHIERFHKEDKIDNPLATRLYRRLDYHAPVVDNPIFQLAS